MDIPGRINEKEAAKGFSKQSLVFDGYDAGNTIIQYKRARVREHVLHYLGRGGTILELNAGTGEDVIFFAREGYEVHATDLAEGMQEKLREKVLREGLTDRVTTELCSFNSLVLLKERGPYDLIFSNFAGLNCTADLDKVLQSLSPLLKRGGQVSMAILPAFSLWEALLIFKGMFRTATRRWFKGRTGTAAHVEGAHFKCWYYSPSYVVRALGEDYELLGLEGLCTIVPPSYIENFAERHARAWKFLKAKEDRWKDKWPWKFIGDYYIISFRKK